MNLLCFKYKQSNIYEYDIDINIDKSVTNVFEYYIRLGNCDKTSQVIILNKHLRRVIT